MANEYPFFKVFTNRDILREITKFYAHCVGDFLVAGRVCPFGPYFGLKNISFVAEMNRAIKTHCYPYVYYLLDRFEEFIGPHDCYTEICWLIEKTTPKNIVIEILRRATRIVPNDYGRMISTNVMTEKFSSEELESIGPNTLSLRRALFVRNLWIGRLDLMEKYFDEKIARDSLCSIYHFPLEVLKFFSEKIGPFNAQELSNIIQINKHFAAQKWAHSQLHPACSGRGSWHLSAIGKNMLETLPEIDSLCPAQIQPARYLLMIPVVSCRALDYIYEKFRGTDREMNFWQTFVSGGISTERIKWAESKIGPVPSFVEVALGRPGFGDLLPELYKMGRYNDILAKHFQENTPIAPSALREIYQMGLLPKNIQVRPKTALKFYSPTLDDFKWLLTISGRRMTKRLFEYACGLGLCDIVYWGQQETGLPLPKNAFNGAIGQKNTKYIEWVCAQAPHLVPEMPIYAILRRNRRNFDWAINYFEPKPGELELCAAHSWWDIERQWKIYKKFGVSFAPSKPCSSNLLEDNWRIKMMKIG